MDETARAKWNRAAGSFDLSSRGGERRWAERKREFFSGMRGRVLFLAAGTGLDFQFFPSGQEILAIDISEEMVERAKPRAEAYDGSIELRIADVQELELEDDSFDQVFTSCTFCSVPDPVKGLRELKRILKPGGELRMFEHTGSKWPPFSAMLHLMTPFSSRFGPWLNRNTVANVRNAGFDLLRVNNIYLDVVKTIHAEAR